MHPSDFLQSLGATADICSAFAPHAAQGLALARVSFSSRDEYRILSDAGELHAEAAGALLYMASTRAELPAVGDWVAVRIAGDGEAIVQAVLPRRTHFSRRTAGRCEDEQLIAANVDVVFLVTGLDHDFNLRRVERYLTLAYESQAEAVIVLNKADLCGDLAGYIGRIRGIAAGLPVIAISAQSPDCIAAIGPFLGHGRTIALLGSSGAGKSTLLNQLLGAEYMRTQAVRVDDSRGRHTTTYRELIPLPQGGAVIDNPGMRELQLWAGLDSLDQTFDDVAALAARCHYHDCEHQSEPGCAVREALESGALDSARWQSYEKLRAEIRYHERKTSPRAAALEKRRWKIIHKAHRANKKHR